VHDYIWATLEPALKSIATTAQEELPEVSMSIDHYESPNHPFSVNVEFRTRESELATRHPLDLYRNLVFVHLECGISWESMENLAELYCASYAQRIRDEVPGTMFFGPARYIDLYMNDAEVKHELDVWVASAANFVRVRLGSIPQDLSTPSRRL
jgi:hypothetical protein